MSHHAPRPDTAEKVRVRPARLLLAAALAAGLAGPAAADSVTDWNAVASQASPAVGGPPQRAYLVAMTQIAVHDALNSIWPRYESYSVLPLANPNASPDAAIAAAAHDVLINQLNRAPSTAAKTTARANVEAAYVAALGAISDGTAENQGIAAGQVAAAAIIAARANDGSATPNLPYVYAAAAGVYQSTAPNFPVPQNAGWALVRPFALNNPSQFSSDASPLFDLTGAIYTRDYNEVKAIGSAAVRGAAPDSEESRIARYWAGGGADWNGVTRTIVNGLGMDRWEEARLFALMEIGEADASISVFDTKYRFNFWRPVTAIRWADDGNPNTASDPGWLPYLTTPPYPDYTCGLTTSSNGAIEVLRRYLGTDAVPYTFTAAGLTRSFNTLSQAAQEGADARVYAGIHFRTGCEDGIQQGVKIGRYVILHLLKPLKSNKMLKPNLVAAPILLEPAQQASGRGKAARARAGRVLPKSAR